jgi:polyhydroxyalkanoate synthesis regulator phasin
MAETPEVVESRGAVGEEVPAAPVARRSPGHRAMDVREAMAELTSRAHEIGAEAGNKMAGAMRDVIGAAAGFAAFAIESARDLVQYMVRRGQMSQDEADRLLRDAEAAIAKRPRLEPPAESPRAQKAAPAVSDRAPVRPAPKAAATSADAPAAHETGRSPARSEAAKAEPGRAERSKGDAAKAAPARAASVKAAPAKAAPAKSAPVKTAARSAAPAKPAARAAKPTAKSHAKAEKPAARPTKATAKAASKTAGKSAARAPVKATKSSAKSAKPAKTAKPAPKKKH